MDTENQRRNQESDEPMNENEQSHHSHQEPESDSAHHDHRPYWKRAHRDWRVWVAVVLMITGMIVYVMSDDLSVRFRSRPPVTLGK
jgi:ABC-type Zn2+ transport system substrate-binding protein/surface adhesin